MKKLNEKLIFKHSPMHLYYFGKLRLYNQKVFMNYSDFDKIQQNNAIK